MSTATQKVVIVGVTGQTGEPIAQGLINSGKFSVIGTVRPESLNKPIVKDLQAIGVSIVPLDWQTAPAAELEALLKGVDTVISACNWEALRDQTRLVDAAKVAGVKRFIPCDWGTICPPGEMKIEDLKRTIHEYIFKAGVPWTIIAVGFWNEIFFPPLAEEASYGGWLYQSFGPGNLKSAVVGRKNIGKLVARIIDDPETIGQRVLAHEDEVTNDEAWALAEKYAPGKLGSKRVRISNDELENKIQDNAEQVSVYAVWLEYQRNMHVTGHNTEAFAKETGWLIARERYADLKLQSADEWAEGAYFTKD
ncbi:hypothetical protein HGRIS_008873 [Hohenbuehelia grisea]|uniref:NmrA-like domain-containing protein n=1 Tax=Hohenbuehelia grisea TaxID=104357 RepID=A0ABR3IZK4_9AGAR